MSDVFVSYKAEDRHRVQPLVSALQADGLDVWWDVQIGGGAAWRDSIERELGAAKCVIVVWSKRSVGPAGSFVRDEASRSMERGTYLPVRIDASRPPLGFGETQMLSLAGWKGNPDDARIRDVVACARSIIAREPRPLAGPAHSAGLSRRTVIGLAAGASAVAAGGAWFFLKPGLANAEDSIAVMPFANLSGDPAQAYFSDGMAEELRNSLSRIAQLKVVARNSSEAVRDDDAKTAASKLGVGNILTGSVRRSPTVIRVSAQLVDGKTGLERWTQSFDRPLGDVLAIQSNIAENVAQALSIQLGNSVLAMGGTHNPEAHDLILKVAFGRGDDSEQGLRRSLESIDAAIALDPNYAEAFAAKAAVLNAYTGNFARTPADTAAGLADAKLAAERAIALAPRLPIAYTSLAAVLRNQNRFRPAFAATQHAVQLPGHNVQALRTFAVYLAQLGRTPEALSFLSQATALDPLNPGSFEIGAEVHYDLHQFDSAIASARHALQLGPGRNRVRSFLGNSLFKLGRAEEATAEYSKMPAADVHALMGLAAIAGASGDIRRSDELLGRMRAEFGDNASYQYAQVYAQRRQPDLAIASLRTAVAVRDPGLAGIQVDPFLDPIRKDPRLPEIIRQLDFPS
jgi:TolB-like protein/Flp pilus assembly protein TadD